MEGYDPFSHTFQSKNFRTKKTHRRMYYFQVTKCQEQILQETYNPSNQTSRTNFTGNVQFVSVLNFNFENLRDFDINKIRGLTRILPNYRSRNWFRSTQAQDWNVDRTSRLCNRFTSLHFYIKSFQELTLIECEIINRTMISILYLETIK